MLLRFAPAAGALGATALLLSACERPATHVQPEVGTLSGVISPAGAAMRVLATHQALQRTYAGVPAADGTFALRNVPNGSYRLTVEPAPGYTEPALESRAVRFGTSSLDTVTMLPAVPASTGSILSYNVGEQTYRFTGVTATLNGPQLTLTAGRSTPGGPPDAEQVFMQVTDFTGPGSYECGRTATIIYQSRLSDVSPPHRWSTDTPEGRGTVRITYHDPVMRRLAGVFTFEADPVNSLTSGRYNTTNGYFADVAY